MKEATQDMKSNMATRFVATQETRVLNEQWLAHFGVDDPKELDLGILEAIRQYVNDGVRPPETA